VISDKFLEVISISLFEIKGWGSSVGVPMGECFDGEMVGAQSWKGVPFTCWG